MKIHIQMVGSGSVATLINFSIENFFLSNETTLRCSLVFDQPFIIFGIFV